MRKAITFFSRSIAVLCSILFIISMVLVLLLVNIQYTLLHARIYRPLLVEHNLYDRLPALIAEQSALLMRFLGDPCADTSLVCAMDGASPELQACLRDSLGEAAYAEIGSGGREPTTTELGRAQPCLDRYGGSQALPTGPAAVSPDENPLSTASAGMQACARQALGDETYEALYNGQRMPTQRETRRINACIREERRQARLSHPGIGGDLTPILRDFSKEQWEQLIRVLLPTEDLRGMTEAALDEAVAYLNGKTETVSISLVDLKQRLTGEAGDELILLILSAQPLCTDEQQARILAGDFENGGDTAIYCAASGETLRMMLPAMQKRLDKVASRIPNEAVLIQPASAINIPQIIGSFGGERRVAIRTIRDWMRLSPLVPLSLLLLVTLFGVRSFKDWLRWWCIPLVIAGLIALGIGITAGPLLDWTWANYAAQTASTVFSSGLGELGHDLSRSLAVELGKWIMLEAGLMIVLGLAGIIRSNHIRPFRRKLKETKHAYTAPEISEAEEAAAKEAIPFRRRDDTGYS